MTSRYKTDNIISNAKQENGGYLVQALAMRESNLARAVDKIVQRQTLMT